MGAKASAESGTFVKGRQVVVTESIVPYRHVAGRRVDALYMVTLTPYAVHAARSLKGFRILRFFSAPPTAARLPCLLFELVSQPCSYCVVLLP
jgi:hypothetical protein